MARDFEFGSGQYIDVGKTTMTTGLNGKAAASISCIINVESFGTGSRALFFINTSSGGQGGFVLGVRSIVSGSDLFLGARSGTGDGFQQALSDGTLNTSQEYVVGGYTDIANDTIRCYIDGSPQTEANVTFGNAVFNTGTPGSNNAIGANLTGPSQYIDGTIAELGIWDVKLTDAEFLILANHYSPLFVRPQNLVSYWRLIRGIDDEILGIVGSNNNTTVVAHPSVIYPANMWPIKPVVAAPGGSPGGILLMDHFNGGFLNG